MTASTEDLFHPIQNQRVSAAIVAQVRTLIADQHLQPGDQLPPERELAQLLGVGRSALREALRTLESHRVIESRSGRGTILLPADPLTILPGAITSPATHAALLETRLIIEPAAAALAAQRSTPEEQAAGRRLLAAQAASVAGGGTGTDADLAFHRLLYVMARNPVLLHLRDSLAEVLSAARYRVHAVPGRPEASLREHEIILAAVEAREADRARAGMFTHLTAVKATLAALQHGDSASPATPECEAIGGTP